MDNIAKYAQIFYGGSIPESQLDKIRKPLYDLVTLLGDDIQAEHPGIDPKMLPDSIGAGLFMMHELGAKHPNVYKSDSTIGIEAFQYAMLKVRETEARKIQAFQEREEEKEVAEKIVLRNKEAGIVYDYFSQVKEWAYTQGYEYPALEAWKALLENKDIELEGYTFFLIAWKIPQENIIKEGRNPVTLYDHPEVIERMNKHPRLPDRNGESMMKLNAQKIQLFT